MIRYINYFCLLLITLFCMTGCYGPGVNAYHRGNDAYQYGDYNVAFANYLYAAHEGVVPAKYNLGYMYLYGQGTQRNEVKGITWLKQAAPDSPRARYALHLIDQAAPKQPWLIQLKKPKLPVTKPSSQKRPGSPAFYSGRSAEAQTHWVRHVSTTSAPCSCFHSLSVLWLPPLVSTSSPVLGLR